MDIKILNPALILIFLMLFQIPFSKENKITGKNKLYELRNLQEEEETFGSATFHFSSTGIKILVNVNVIPETDSTACSKVSRL